MTDAIHEWNSNANETMNKTTRNEHLHLSLSLTVYNKQRNECQKTVIGNDIENKRNTKKYIYIYLTMGLQDRIAGKAKIFLLHAIDEVSKVNPTNEII